MNLLGCQEYAVAGTVLGHRWANLGPEHLHRTCGSVDDVEIEGILTGQVACGLAVGTDDVRAVESVNRVVERIGGVGDEVDARCVRVSRKTEAACEPVLNVDSIFIPKDAMLISL